MPDWITIRGARQNNLKNIDVSIPKNQLVVITGPSGAGKSSLAFDTLYAEGQRRYVESLSPSARQFLTQLEKPDVDAIDGLGPAIAIEQRTGAANPRSTVGTATEIYDYLRLFFARVGKPVCYRCGQAIAGHTVQQIVDAALAQREGTRVLVCAPLEYDPALDFAEYLARYRKAGFVRLRIGGQAHLLEEEILPPKEGEPISLVVDRLVLNAENKQRLTEAVELALEYGAGLAAYVYLDDSGESETVYSKSPRCVSCGITYPEAHPRNFSFNSPFGACGECHGMGHHMSVSPELVVPQEEKSLAEGAVAPWEKRNSPAFHQMLEQVATHFGFSIFAPFAELQEAHRQVILQGSGSEELEFSYDGDGSSYRYSRNFEGVIPNLERRFKDTESASVREEIRRYMVERICRECNGERLRKESLHILIGGLSIAGLTRLNLEEAAAWVDALDLPPEETQIAGKLVEEVSHRIGFLRNVGLDYLSLDRTMDTLSSGESQRIRLATQIGSALSGVIYILDEPTIGLHQRDTGRLLNTLYALRDAGNSVVVVEHDRDTLAAADYLIEIGPQAGAAGGELVAHGKPSDLRKMPHSKTGQYLAGALRIPVPKARRAQSWQKLELLGASANNLTGLDIVIPLGLLTCVTGVSGSGKSTLILDTLYPALLGRLRHKSLAGLACTGLRGHEYVERVVHVDQSPIGKSSRSNPGTYLGIFTLIREQFAALPESRARGYSARRFSFNVEGGRCEACLGEGVKRIEMHFLPDVFVRCDTCGGSRYNRETLEVRYRGKTVSDILNMTISEVEQFFRAIPAIRARLQPMLGVGLGYLCLGQAANTLSGGEAQRLKIARELGRRHNGRTLYLLDEPTTGLHVEEVELLVNVFNQLVDNGNSVVVIEHNLELIKCADYVIDLGPEAGARGGRVVAQGTPEELLSQQENSHTAVYLRPYLTGEQPENKDSSGGKDSYLHSTG
ncbi:MAG: excinuclease ABC subunit UvrA [SAR324 cluster bacterium]|nr:excinuclease ABC subunit UvrA [SAR324 cluster bacterium]